MEGLINTNNNEGSKESIDQMVEYALLYDFYGALLKDKNSRIFEDYIFNDMSLSEIADEAGITRQGVGDIVRRSGRKLFQYEESLGLIKKFNCAKKLVCDVKEETQKIKDCINGMDNECLAKDNISLYLDIIDKKTDCILEEL